MNSALVAQDRFVEFSNGFKNLIDLRCFQLKVKTEKKKKKIVIENQLQLKKK